MSFSVAIDGPAGAGKSTIAKKIAKVKGYIYVDTGAMYRAMALFFIRNNASTEDMNSIEALCKQADITITHEKGEQIVLLNGENVNALIRTEEVGKMASACAVNREVRLKLVELQRQLAGSTNVIMDGRDIGTYVLPNADVKIYLTAGSRIRAERRYKELTQKGVACDINTIEEDIIQRDYQDMNRSMAPLKQADDAIVVDSTQLSIKEVVGKIIKLCE